MLEINIQAMKDGEYPIELEAPAETVEGILPEFFGSIVVVGKLRKIGNRFTVISRVQCSANMVCDRSLECYVEQIEARLSVSFFADTTLLKTNAGNGSETNDVVIHQDAKTIDLSDEIRQLLALSLPMKRIAPQYRDKSFEEAFPQYTSRLAIQTSSLSDTCDERWSPLKKLKIN